MLKNNFPEVSIIFSNLNGGKEPIECLESIKKLSYPQGKIETIVVDNHSTDGSLQKIAKFPNVKLIKLKKAIGLPKSLNLGIKKSRGKYILIGNDDIVFDKNSIIHMVNYLEKNSEVGILGGKVFYKDQPKKLTDSALNFNYYLGIIKKPKSAKDILYLQSCSIMVPRKVFERVGLFDEGFYPLYFDDFDFSLRVKKAKLKLAYLPKVIFWHGCGKTTEKADSKQRYYWWYRNKIRFMIKNAPVLSLLSSLTIQFLTLAVKSIAEKQNLLPIIAKAFIENIKDYPEIINSRENNFKNGFR